MSRRPIIAGNWKMHKTIAEALALVQEIKEAAAGCDGVEVAVCPPFTALAPVVEALRGTDIAVGAQNVHWEDKGAYTGEISPVMLRDAGCRYVIIGHSERRQYFGETDENVNRKVKAVFAQGLTPIMCVGETLAEREAGVTEKVVRTQTEAGLAALTGEQVAGMVIAYEPVWAIGTGKTASDEDAQQVISFIRGIVAGLYGDSAAGRVRIQYGGSVKPENAAGLMAKPDIDGALVGGASLEAASFTGIIRAVVSSE
ncbi:triose-phosphate isomerase [Pelotomaculum propionicicum]|uniref:Triosephosphate isomerase n=1 Tax=Pelotomaculum propionicicum TaxID=258475 RepID=A0A4Y7RP55_9FIRM|nr:triose-phosphate isomerase [Pelotomaculum propionicicum]NLI14422.1 triose-phosphate isomerase [Peptococcaceae bacterium]TEB10097.1 Triosephosphate isomerase [Pelotomaculum propionicicum]